MSSFCFECRDLLLNVPFLGHCLCLLTNIIMVIWFTFSIEYPVYVQRCLCDVTSAANMFELKYELKIIANYK